MKICAPIYEQYCTTSYGDNTSSRDIVALSMQLTVKSLLKEYIARIIRESQESRKRLRIFDFDDTIVKTDTHVWVTHEDGSKEQLTPGEYAIYEKQPGDQFDYSEFQKLINPREIYWTGRILKAVYSKHGSKGVVILTARGSSTPVEQFLQDLGLGGIEVIALGSSDPDAKANWISDRIVKDDLRYVEFFDDSPKNVAAVEKLKQLHPDVLIVTRHVVHKAPRNR